jgi:hypothetical protein
VAVWQTLEACIVVKTYPTPAWNGVEVSCTAAVTKDGKWLRLFPIPFRFLSEEQKFKKYQWISVRVKKSSDARPESFNVDTDSIRVITVAPLPTDNKWAARRELIGPLVAPSICSLKAARDKESHPTLGIFKPKRIHRLVIEHVGDEWSDAERAKLRQGDMFDASLARELEKIPFKFSYEFECDARNCTGHQLMCSDWEMGQAYRAWRRTYKDEWEKSFRLKFERDMIERNDTHFYVGTVAAHPANWIIVGLFYPKL